MPARWRPIFSMRPSAAEAGRGGGRIRIALAVEPGEWHARVLATAFEARGAHVRQFGLDACAFDAAAPGGLRLPGFEDGLPDACLVKTVSGGSFEAVTRRLGLLHALRDLGVTVWNDARAIERCVDKSAASFRLARAGLPTPATWAVEGRAAAAAIVAREAAAGPLVLKPLFGSQGRGLKLVRHVDDLPPPEPLGDVYYLQRFIGAGQGPHEDHRCFVVAGRAAASMVRRGSHWITNVRQGGAPAAMRADPELDALAVAAARAVGADYCGVDIMRDGAGRPMVLEVNSMPAWAALQSVTAVDIAGSLAEALLAALPQAVPAEAAP